MINPIVKDKWDLLWFLCTVLVSCAIGAMFALSV